MTPIKSPLCKLLIEYTVLYSTLRIQVANYILWSLMLAALHVCACAIVWKLSTLPETSNPSLVLRLLFVRSMHRSFWVQFLTACRFHRKPTSITAGSTPGAESAYCELPQRQRHNLQQVMGNGKDIQPTYADTNSTRDAEVQVEKHTNKSYEKVKIGETWEAIATGLNRLTIVSYLLGNALVFAIYLYPIFYRIIMHSAISGYVLDID